MKYEKIGTKYSANGIIGLRYRIDPYVIFYVEGYGFVYDYSKDNREYYPMIRKGNWVHVLYDLHFIPSLGLCGVVIKMEDQESRQRKIDADYALFKNI